MESITLSRIVSDPELLNMVSEGRSEMADFLKFCHSKGIETIGSCTGHYIDGKGYVGFGNLDCGIAERIDNSVNEQYKKVKDNTQYLSNPSGHNIFVGWNHQNMSQALGVMRSLISGEQIQDSEIRNSISSIYPSQKREERPVSKEKEESLSRFVELCRQNNIKLNDCNINSLQKNYVAFRNLDDSHVSDIIRFYCAKNNSRLRFSSSKYKHNDSPSVTLYSNPEDFEKMINSFSDIIEGNKKVDSTRIPQDVQDMINIASISQKMKIDMSVDRGKYAFGLTAVQMDFINLLEHEMPLTLDICGMIEEKPILKNNVRLAKMGLGSKRIFHRVNKICQGLSNIHRSNQQREESRKKFIESIKEDSNKPDLSKDSKPTLQQGKKKEEYSQYK